MGLSFTKISSLKNFLFLTKKNYADPMSFRKKTELKKSQHFLENITYVRENSKTLNKNKIFK